MKGIFIVFEGPDGSGQSTQADLLEKWFQSRNVKVYLTKEPTSSLIGGIIRSILKGEWDVSMRTLQLLFSADRAHHLKREIIPYLEKGINVVSDRYILSTLAFGSPQESLDWLKQINSNFPEPDLTFILDVPGKVCAERIAKSRFGFEIFETTDKLERTRENYLGLKFYHKNTHAIKGDHRSPDEIHKEIVAIVEEYCKEKGIKI